MRVVLAVSESKPQYADGTKLIKEIKLLPFFKVQSIHFYKNGLGTDAFVCPYEFLFEKVSSPRNAECAVPVFVQVGLQIEFELVFTVSESEKEGCASIEGRFAFGQVCNGKEHGLIAYSKPQADEVEEVGFQNSAVIVFN